ncbi:hypothetical protein SAMN04487786_1117 [Paenisporosarcina quisquiliarum]|nr:hypothetical protein SAMN04487786_1117 [Paenisporosarcina quisquiliarum]
MKEELYQLLIRNLEEMHDNFNNYSLLINASEISKKHYEKAPKNTQVNPMGNIPAEYRAKIEMTKTYRGPQLVKLYENQTKVSATEDYFIRGVSICDALLEDIYEIFLLNKDPLITDKKLDKQIQFSEDNLPMDLLSYTPDYTNHKGLEEVNLKDYFLQYNLYRQLRHAMIHNKGKLKQRHLKRINNILTEIETRTGKKYDINHFPFIKNNKVIADMELMVVFRKFQLELHAQLYANLT